MSKALHTVQSGARLLGSLWLLVQGTGCAAPPDTRALDEIERRGITLVAARVRHPEKAASAEGATEAGPDRPAEKAGPGEKPVPPLHTAPDEGPPEKQGNNPPPANPLTAAYRLRPGNSIRIDLLGIPDARVVDDVIDETGLINLMYIGQIRAAGKTAHQLEREIEQEYIAQKIYKQISVNVVVQAKQYFVRGEVQRPGSFPLTAGATLSQAIAVSGGFSEFANLKKIRISRGGKTVTVNFKDIEKDSRKDIPLEVGDTIVVTRSVF